MMNLDFIQGEMEVFGCFEQQNHATLDLACGYKIDSRQRAWGAVVESGRPVRGQLQQSRGTVVVAWRGAEAMERVLCGM